MRKYIYTSGIDGTVKHFETLKEALRYYCYKMNDCLTKEYNGETYYYKSGKWIDENGNDLSIMKEIERDIKKYYL